MNSVSDSCLTFDLLIRSFDDLFKLFGCLLDLEVTRGSVKYATYDYHGKSTALSVLLLSGSDSGSESESLVSTDITSLGSSLLSSGS